MAAAVNIVVNDAENTPVAHTFVPLGPQGRYDMVYEDQSSNSAPNGYWRIGVVQKRPAGARVAGAPIVTTIVLMEPVLEAIAPAASGLTQPPTVAYVPTMEVVFKASDRSTLQQRKNLRKTGYELLNNAQIIAWVESLVPSW